MGRYTVSLEKELSRLEAKRQRKEAQTRVADEPQMGSSHDADPAAPSREEMSRSPISRRTLESVDVGDNQVVRKPPSTEGERGAGSREALRTPSAPKRDGSSSSSSSSPEEEEGEKEHQKQHADPTAFRGGSYSSSSGSRFDILSTYRNVDRMVSSEAKKASARRRRTHENSIHSCCQGSVSSGRNYDAHESATAASSEGRPDPVHAQSPRLPSSSSSSSSDEADRHGAPCGAPPSFDAGSDLATDDLAHSHHHPLHSERSEAAQNGAKESKEPGAIPRSSKENPDHTPNYEEERSTSSCFPVKVRIPSKGPYKRLLPQPFSHVLVLDFEATCESAAIHYPHEIIEFPVVVLDTRTLKIVAEFHRYVRPTHNPTLSNFCTELTGITQAQVDVSNTIDVVLQEFQMWLEETVYPLCREWKSEWEETCALAVAQGSSPTEATKRLYPSAASELLDACGLSRNIQKQKKQFVLNKNHTVPKTFKASENNAVESRTFEEEESMICFATDGPWDMRKFMFDCEVLMHHRNFPPLFYRFINVRNCFTQAFKCKPMKLTHMLRKLQMSFEGRRHSGIDDTRNILRVLAELLARGYRIHHVSTIQYRADSNAGLKHDQAANELLKEYDGANSSGIGIARRQNNNNSSNNNKNGSNGQKKKKK